MKRQKTERANGDGLLGLISTLGRWHVRKGGVQVVVGSLDR